MDKTFSPYFDACEMGGFDHKSGINWSYVSFITKKLAQEFEQACNNNGYRTRNLHETEHGNFSIQYHHYQD